MVTDNYRPSNRKENSGVFVMVASGWALLPRRGADERVRVCHLTSVHGRYDIRIFHKMCVSLASQGCEVFLVVADGNGDEAVKGVNIIDVGPSRSRFDRIRNAPRRVLDKALSIDSVVYHLHDPELIPIASALRKKGKRVVFDSHEDVPKQLLGKPYLNAHLLWLISRVYAGYESWACRRVDGIIGATPAIEKKFSRINACTAVINNYPLLGELDSDIQWRNKMPEVCYVGGIASARGIKELVESLRYIRTNAKLNLAGSFSEPMLESSLRSSPGWASVRLHGFLGRDGVRGLLERSVAGLVTLHPRSNYVEAMPIKMFEYMSAGIPVIASDFPVWREIIEANECGICVNPLDPKAIARAIDYFVENPSIAERMGSNGKRAVLEKYNWGNEFTKLIDFYQRVVC